MKWTPLKVWKPDDQDEPDKAVWVPSPSCETLEDMAAEYAENRYHKDDYPAEQRIHVRRADGALHVFNVETRQTLLFIAKRVDENGGA